MLDAIRAAVAFRSSANAGHNGPSALDSLRQVGAAAVPAGGAIVVYIALLTLAARREDVGGARLGAVWGWLLPAPYVLAAFAYRPDHPAWTIAVAAAFFGWTIHGARLARSGCIPGAVSCWLAGICLADALLLMLMNREGLVPLACVAWFVTVLAQRRVPGT